MHEEHVSLVLFAKYAVTIMLSPQNIESRRLPAAVVKLRCEMELLGIYRAELSKQSGVALGTLTKLLAGYPQSAKTNAKIEAFINQPLWTDSEEWVLRGQIEKQCGVNVATASKGELYSVAQRFSVRGRGTSRKSRALLLKIITKNFKTTPENPLSTQSQPQAKNQ
jgi:hypothetical protein